MKYITYRYNKDFGGQKLNMKNKIICFRKAGVISLTILLVGICMPLFCGIVSADPGQDYIYVEYGQGIPINTENVRIDFYMQKKSSLPVDYAVFPFMIDYYGPSCENFEFYFDESHPNFAFSNFSGELDGGNSDCIDIVYDHTEIPGNMPTFELSRYFSIVFDTGSEFGDISIFGGCWSGGAFCSNCFLGDWTLYPSEIGFNQDQGAFVDFFMYLPGDADGSEAVDIDDVVFLINYIFSGGDAPFTVESGDPNGDGSIDIDDVVYLINYIFAGGPEPLPGV